MLASNRILLLDVVPRVGSKLLHTERHLASLAVQGEDLSLNFVTDLEEVLCGVETGAPRHLRDMDKTFDAGFDLDECAVVGDENNLSGDLVANLEVGIQVVPRMRGELLETKSNPLLLIVEVENDHLDLLAERDDLLGVVDTAPGEIGDVDETVHSAKVHEHTVVGDVLDLAFEDLTLLQFADEFSPLGFLLSLEQSFVRDDHIVELLVDLDDLEVYRLTDELIVIMDRLDIDVAAGEESLDAKDVHDHTALRAGLHIALDDLVLLESLADAVPGLESAGLLVGKHELALLVLGRLYEYFYLVTNLKVRVVAEIRC